MSQLATFNLIEISKLSELSRQAEIVITKGFLSKKTIDNYWAYLNDNSTILYGLNAEDLNGGIFLSIILYLKDKKGVDLEQSPYKELSIDITQKRQTTTLILTREHTEKFNSVMDIENVSIQECQSINIDYSDDDLEESANDMKEGLVVLQQVLSKLVDDYKVVIFSIG